MILGLPGETELDMLNTIRYLNKQDIQGIKFHLLHLMKNTKLVELYERGELKFLSQEEYVDIICSAIGMTSPNIVIHRLTGDAPRNLLIGPLWSLKKWEILNSIDMELEKRGIYQGIYYR
jgi:radical SAM protein (TIGR01212 family)